MVLDSELNVFRFAHLSVREYFEGREEFSSTHANMVIFGGCMNLFNTFCSYDWSDEFTAYAICYWPIHLEEILKSGHSPYEEVAKGFFNCDKEAHSVFTNWVKAAKALYESLDWAEPFKPMLDEAITTPPSPIFIACYLELTSLLKFLDKIGTYDLNRPNRNQHTCLHLSAERGHLPIVSFLTSRLSSWQHGTVTAGLHCFMEH